jgi:hypothetical protein
MADQKISAMPSAATLTGAELVPLVQSGANVKATLDTLRAYDSNYGAFSSNTDQTGSVSAGTAMTFDSTDLSGGVTLASGSRLTVPVTGKYNVQFSAQLKNVENAQYLATIWFRVNGVDVANSATNITVPARKSAGIFGYNVASWNIFLALNANDYVEIVWLPEIATMTLENLPLSTSPAYPAIPSVIATVNQVA